MARLTPERQAAKVAEARRLSQQGYTRRQITPILKAKYGEDIHPRLYTPIYRERVAATKKRLERLPVPRRQPEPEPQKAESKRRSTLLAPSYKRPARTFKERMYQSLRSAGFSSWEADTFSAYWRKYSPPGGGRKQYPPFLIELVKDRKAIKEAHNIEARAKGWSAKKSNAEFARKITAVYKDLERKRSRGGVMGKFLDAPFVDRVWVRAKGNRPGYWKSVPKRINPWALKEATFMALPDSDQWDTPRSHWNRPQTAWSTSPAMRQYNKKAILDEIRVHKQDIARSGDPTGWHGSAILGLQYRLKEGLY